MPVARLSKEVHYVPQMPSTATTTSIPGAHLPRMLPTLRSPLLSLPLVSLLPLPHRKRPAYPQRRTWPASSRFRGKVAMPPLNARLPYPCPTCGVIFFPGLLSLHVGAACLSRQSDENLHRLFPPLPQSPAVETEEKIISKCG
jgi:hypothetical protein